MDKTICIILLILGGVALIIISAFDYIKNAKAIKTTDVQEHDRQLKYKLIINSLTGICFIILGIVVILNLFKDNIVELSFLIILLASEIVGIMLLKH